MVVYSIPVRKVKTIRAAILSGEIKKKTKTRSNPLYTLATHLRTDIRSRKPGKSLQVVMKIVNRLTKSTCQSLKTRKTRDA